MPSSKNRLPSSKNRRRELKARKFRSVILEHLESRRLLAADLTAWSAEDQWRPSWESSVGHDNSLQFDNALDASSEHAGEQGLEGFDRLGNRIFVEAPEPGDLEHTGDGPGGGDSPPPGNAPLADTFKLHSRPNALHTIYLDFDGHTTTGTTWNASSGITNIVSPAYDPSNDGAGFNNSELERIQRIWQRVAEDFAPFQVNVTTEDPGAAALSRNGGGDTEWGTRVVVTVDWDNCGCGGFAYLNSFNDTTDEPVFVFNASEIGVSAASTHEVGHALGLSHDGLTTGAAYYNGHGSGQTGYGPIMGSGYYSNMTTWDEGDYYNANNSQNDWQVITTQNGFGYRLDDHGDNSGAATLLDNYGANTSDPSLIDVGGFGVIELGGDNDWFSFDAGDGLVNLTINSYAAETFVNNGLGFTRYVEATPVGNQGSNLDVLATLYDSNLNVVATSNPSADLSAAFTNVNVTAGVHYISIDGVGFGDWTQSTPTGYDESVSRGQFAISGAVPASSIGLIAQNDSATTNVDQSVAIAVLANDTDPQGGTFGITTLGNPSDGAATHSAGVVTYTPNSGFFGSDAFSYTITDNQGDTATATVTITINPPTPPILLVDDDQGAAFEQFYTTALDDNNLGYDVWTVTSSGLPATGDLAGYSAVIWNTGYDYSASTAGLSSSEQTAIGGYLDGGGSIFVVGQDILYNGVSTSFLNNYLKVSQFTSDVRGLSSFVGSSASPIGNGLNLPFQLPASFASDWSDTIAPTNDAEGVFYRNTVNSNAQPYNTVAYSGQDFRVVFMAAPFEGISSSASDPNNQKVVMGRVMDFLMGQANQPPVATDNSYSTAEDTSLASGNVLTDGVADSDPDGDPLTVITTPDSPPAHGSLTLQADGTFTYTPDQDYNGADSFVYRISDGQGGEDTATVDITVTSVNDNPIAVDDVATTEQDVAVSGNVLPNDSDVDGDTLTVETTPLVSPSDGAVSLAGNGTFTYTPNPGFVGNDSFVYRVGDGNGGSDTATVSITVEPVNQPPVANNDSAATNEDNAVAGNVLSNDSDPENDTLTVATTPVTNVQNGALQLNSNGTFTYTPNPNYFGTDSFVYEIDDGNGNTDTATVNITIASVNDAPTLATPGDVNLLQDAPQQTIGLSGIGAGGGESQTLTITATSSNPSLIPDPNVNYSSPSATGSLTFTPTAGAAGSATITVTVTDNGGTANGGVNTYSTSFDVTISSPSSDWLYFSRKNAGSIGGVNFDPQDIIAYDGTQFSTYFDGTPWLSGLVIDAFAITDADDILLSFTGAGSVSGAGVSFDDSDIVKFEPDTQTWSIYFDGSDVGLTRNGEDVDALSVVADGTLLISTSGTARVSGVTARDEDIMAFAPTSLGSTTSGAWSLYFDGSDVGLGDSSSEDVDAVSVTSDGGIHFSTTGSFSVSGLTGADEDVGRFNPNSLGGTTSGAFQSSLVFDGSALGFTNDIGGLHLAPASSSTVAPAIDAGLADGFSVTVYSTLILGGSGTAELAGEGEGGTKLDAVNALNRGHFDSTFLLTATIDADRDSSGLTEGLLELLAQHERPFDGLDWLFAHWDG